MGIGVSLFLIAVGAILRWAVTVSVEGADIQTIGLILLIVGIIGLVLSLLMWSSVGTWYPGRRVASTGSTTVVHDDRPQDPTV